MKRKMLIALLSATVAVCCAFGLAACDQTETGKSVQEITNVTQAYNVATELGYDGTLEQFIAALRGKDGLDGVDGNNGSNGTNGKDGKDGVDGKDGIDGKDGKDGVGVRI